MLEKRTRRDTPMTGWKKDQVLEKIKAGDRSDKSTQILRWISQRDG